MPGPDLSRLPLDKMPVDKLLDKLPEQSKLGALLLSEADVEYDGAFSITTTVGPISQLFGTFTFIHDPDVLPSLDIIPTWFSSSMGTAVFTTSNTTVDVGFGLDGTAGNLVIFIGGTAGGGNNGLSGNGGDDFRIRAEFDSSYNLLSVRGGYTLNGDPTIYLFDTADSTATGTASVHADLVFDPEIQLAILGGATPNDWAVL